MMSPATRIRTVMATSSHVELGVLGQRKILAAHLVDPQGCILMHPGSGPCWDRLAAGEPCPQLDLTAMDVTSVPQRDRLRATVRMQGRLELIATPTHCQLQNHLQLRTGQPMARFIPTRVVLGLPNAQRSRAVAVPVRQYAEAITDPLAGWEAAWTNHLDTAHSASLRKLASQHTPLSDSDVVRALQADSCGLVLRLYGAATQRDIRIDFPAPARCGRQAVAAFNDLVNRLARGSSADQPTA